jgi:DNA-directed RNA polymerase specialized sigma24 family protein
MHTPQDIRVALEQLLANRHTPEARGMYMTLARYTHRRVDVTSGRRYSDILSRVDREEIVGEVILQLMSGALARFKGNSVAELLGFVRTIADRMVGHAARKRIRERNTLAGEMGDEVRSWMGKETAPDHSVRMNQICPLTEEDAAYLTALFGAGSRADLARDRGISRAAVTQRLNRIRNRIDAMPPKHKSHARNWVEDLALRSEQSKAPAVLKFG